MKSLQRTRLRALALILVCCAMAWVSRAERDMPDGNLLIPVLITLSSQQSASGFYLGTTSALYLVTTTHALFAKPAYEDLQSSRATLLGYSGSAEKAGKIVLDVDLDTLLASGRIRRHSDHDVLVMQIGTIGASGWTKLLPGVELVEKEPPAKFLRAAISDLTQYDSVRAGDEIFVFGYPVSIGLKASPQIDYDAPLLNKGVLSGKNDAKRTLIIAAAVYGGNSGGPVAEVYRDGNGTRRRIIGIVTEYICYKERRPASGTDPEDRYWNSGYSVVEPSDFIVELIREAEEPAEQPTEGPK